MGDKMIWIMTMFALVLTITTVGNGVMFYLYSSVPNLIVGMATAAGAILFWAILTEEWMRR